jgi:hypothetical protein
MSFVSPPPASEPATIKEEEPPAATSSTRWGSKPRISPPHTDLGLAATPLIKRERALKEGVGERQPHVTKTASGSLHLLGFTSHSNLCPSLLAQGPSRSV